MNLNELELKFKNLIIDFNNKYKNIETKVYKKLELSEHHNWLKRFNHSISVANKACYLSLLHYNDEVLAEKAYLSGLIHDYCKYVKADEYIKVIEENNLDMKYDERVRSIYHGILAPYFIKNELKIDDCEILNAIECHVTGKENMSPLEKILYVSDYVEDLREGETYEISRKISEESLDVCVAYNSKSILSYLLEKNYAIFATSIATYNYYIKYLEPESI